MPKILIVYDTYEGQTEKIAKFLTSQLEHLGNQVDVVMVQNAPTPVGYDGVVIGAPVRMQKFSKRLRRWVKENADVISQKESAFFAVCLGVLQSDKMNVQSEERKIVDEFLSSCLCIPRTVEIFAGALKYSKYNWITKQMMRMISKKAKGDTDTARDYEYTDWNQVEEFAVRYSKEVRGPIAKVAN